MNIHVSQRNIRMNVLSATSLWGRIEYESAEKSQSVFPHEQRLPSNIRTSPVQEISETCSDALSHLRQSFHAIPFDEHTSRQMMIRSTI
jgi:hypothetical protein